MRWAYKRSGGLNWAKDVRRGWLPAELSEPFRAIVARAGLSADVTAYSLRHSSIVRGFEIIFQSGLWPHCMTPRAI
jgi:hypothetical protein